MTCTDALRELVQAALRFEFKAARQQRMEQERSALREAITRAQLLLSVSGPQPASRQPNESTSYLRPAPSLKAIKGGKGVMTGGKTKGKTRRGTIKRKDTP
jgi:hypothetical protein